ncbi:hypothetical protein NDU88_001501 [Pleurodeles waltl]|uniref:Basic proline-rich protein-like n=1 Tax=Pleurodeles waltl TaxID=8319 RepID=A0AAV7KTK5_PLEWA|nr:hypothetical protein NDU88_001501 [Pleurodeles waltl]
MLPQSSSRSIRSRAGEGRSQAPRPPSPLQLPRGRVGRGRHRSSSPSTPPVYDSPPCPPGAPLWISGARASATAPARHRKPPRRSGRAPGPPGHTRASRAGVAPLTPRPPLRQEGGGVRRCPRGRDPSPGRAPALTGPLASKFKFPPAGGSRGPGPPPRPQPGTASRPGGQGGLPVLRVTLALRAPVRRRSPRAPLHDRRGGGAAGALAAGIHPRGAPELSPGLSPPLDPQQTTSSGPQSPPQIRRAQLAAAAILSSSSREQPGRRMRVSRRLFINSSHQTSLQVPGTPGRHV